MDYMLGRIGIGGRWCSWMYKCISTTSFLVLMNGSPSRLFGTCRRHKQGDPLSPFLFTMVMEAPGAFLARAKGLGLIGGFGVGGKMENIIHLQCADDTILFSSSKWE